MSPVPEPSEARVWDDARLADPHGQPDKAARVRAMFDAIAPTYERVNRLASLGLDARWRRALVAAADVRADDVLVDVACGTGDVCRAFAGGRPAPARIVGVDFAANMLELAQARPAGGTAWCRADALRLPLRDGSASIVTSAFGVRNFQDLGVGLREMWRVLRPGGRALILEFGLPTTPVLRRLYGVYFTRVMPRVAALLARDRAGAYRYLPRSVLSFADRAGIVASLSAAGFASVDVIPLTLGVVSIYRARK